MLLPLSALCLLLPSLVACQDDELFAEDLVQACYREAVAALEAGAGIRLPEPVEVVVLTAEEAAERRARYAATIDRGEDGGITAAMDVMADLMFSETMLGRYLPDEKVVYVLEDVLLAQAGGDRETAMEMLFPILAHEIVHAYDDQVYGAVPRPDSLAEMLGDPKQAAGIQTHMSLIEGRATYASELACAAAGREPLPAPSVEGARAAEVLSSDGSMGGDMLAGLGNAVVRAKLVQYAQGRAFAKSVHDFGGEAFFAHVFDHLPLSSAELADFHVFLVRWAEEVEAAELAEESERDGEANGAGTDGPGPAEDGAEAPGGEDATAG